MLDSAAGAGRGINHLARCVRVSARLSNLRVEHGCASIAQHMNAFHPVLRDLIEMAVAEGVGMDDIEQGLLDPANLPRDEHDALWLYAFGRIDFPNRRTIPIVAG